MAHDPATATNITIVVDDQAGRGLRGEHGFAAWIETGGQRLLFDTGQGPALESNADGLGIDLGTTDDLVLSHGHYDHTGGVPVVLDSAPAVRIHAHPDSTRPRYSISHGSARSIAIPAAARAALETLGSGMRWVAEPLDLADGIGLTGPIPRLTEYEDTGGPFFTDARGAHPDPITDDLALWVRTKRGLVVVVGCSHAGLINTLRHALDTSGVARIHAVLGGFHLVNASHSRLRRTMDALLELAPDLIIPCHCTGGAAVELLRQTFGERVVPASAGAAYTFEGSGTPR